MKTIFDHIETVRQQPIHVRKQVAFGSAGAVTAVIALVWVVGSLTTGAFAIQGSSFAESVGGGRVIATTSPQDNKNLAGAAAAFSSGSSEPARIEIVTAPASTTAPQVDATVLPF